MTGVTGSLNFGTTVGVGLKKKVAGAEQPLWGVNFVVSILSLPQHCRVADKVL
jgi:hypothetical protein